MACLDAVSHDDFSYSLLILACNWVLQRCITASQSLCKGMGTPRDASPTSCFAHPVLDLSSSRSPAPHQHHMPSRMVSLDTLTDITGTVTVFISGGSQLEEFIQWDSNLLELNWWLATLWPCRYDGAVTRSLQGTCPAQSKSLWKALPRLPSGLHVDPLFACSGVLWLKSLSRWSSVNPKRKGTGHTSWPEDVLLDVLAQTPKWRAERC